MTLFEKKPPHDGQPSDGDQCDRINHQIEPAHSLSHGTVDLGGATIGGDLDCSGGHFSAVANEAAFKAYNAKIEGSVFLCNGFRAEGEVNFEAATIGEHLRCDAGQFACVGESPALHASGMKIEGGVLMRHGFRAEGQVNFVASTIGVNFECDGG